MGKKTSTRRRTPADVRTLFVGMAEVLGVVAAEDSERAAERITRYAERIDKLPAGASCRGYLVQLHAETFSDFSASAAVGLHRWASEIQCPSCEADMAPAANTPGTWVCSACGYRDGPR